MNEELIQRLNELEIRVAFQDDLLATLNSHVAAVDRELRALREELERARETLATMRNALSHDPGNEPPPPHY